MKRTTRVRNAGFTLVELMLAMAFFGSVLIIATLLFTQTLNIYNKGMTVKQMSQVGRTLIEDITRIVNSGQSIEIGQNNKAEISCISVDKNTVYLWNIADPTATVGSGYTSDYYTYSDGAKEPINFVKLTNQNGKNCASYATNREVARSEASAVVGDTVRVYSMSAASLNGTDKLTRIAMLLGTFDTVGSSYNLSYNTSTNNFECRAGGVGNFCAKAQFETVLYAPNGGLN